MEARRQFRTKPSTIIAGAHYIRKVNFVRFSLPADHLSVKRGEPKGLFLQNMLWETHDL